LIRLIQTPFDKPSTIGENASVRLPPEILGNLTF
jgi:hypothetical protein